ncbi:MAG: RNA polymerase sigma factor [Clostridiales bacterium]|nr:RNA polymerase sigma factor [Clostridiales bacterium]
MLPNSLRTGERVREVMDAYGAMIYRLAYARTLNRSDAEDVFQEVMLRYVKQDQPFKDDQHEKAWLIRVACNVSIHIVKSAWYRRTVSLEHAPLPDVQENADIDDDLLDAMARLSPKYRVPIHLFYFEDMTVEEISLALARKPSTVRTQLTRGREHLKRYLIEGGCTE